MAHKSFAIAWIAIFSLLFATAPRGSAQDAAELAVIVHPSKAASTSQLSAADLQAIFTRRKQFWSDGSKITPLNLARTNAARAVFDQTVLNFDADASQRFWIDQQIRGGARAPAEVATPELVLRTLQVIKDAVSYVPAGMVTANVQVIARIRGGKVVLGR